MVKLSNQTSERVVYSGDFLRVVTKPVNTKDGGTILKEIVERIDGVSVLPVTNDNNFIFIQQYLPAQDSKVLKLPGGGLTGGIQDPVETPSEAAYRELEEETGYRAGGLELYFTNIGSGTIRQETHYFVAKDLIKANFQRINPNEDLETVEIKRRDAYGKALRGEFADPSVSLLIIQYGVNSGELEIRN